MRKFSADEREAYKGTLSEETEIKNGIPKKWRKPQVFNLNSFYLYPNDKDGAQSAPRHNPYYSVFGYAQISRP